MAALDTVILAVSFRPAEFNQDLCDREGLAFPVLSDSDRAVIKRYNVWNREEDTARRVTFWIDREGVIRRVWQQVSPSAMGENLRDFAKKWRKGRGVYLAHCARCHGADGNETGYTNIKTLGGIGNRLNEEEILRATQATGLVDFSQLTSEEVEALIAYVAGL